MSPDVENRKGHDSVQIAANEQRWEVGAVVGPCTEAEVEHLMEVMAELPEVKALGGCVAAHVWKDDDGEA